MSFGKWRTICPGGYELKQTRPCHCQHQVAYYNIITILSAKIQSGNLANADIVIIGPCNGLLPIRCQYKPLYSKWLFSACLGAQFEMNKWSKYRYTYYQKNIFLSTKTQKTRNTVNTISTITTAICSRKPCFRIISGLSNPILCFNQRLTESWWSLYRLRSPENPKPGSIKPCPQTNGSTSNSGKKCRGIRLIYLFTGTRSTKYCLTNHEKQDCLE